MRVTKLLQRATCLILALVMLFSFPAGVYSEGTGTNPSEAPEIPEGYVWRTLSVELAPFEEEQKEEEEEEAARWEQKAAEAAHFLELMFSRSAELAEEPAEPTIEVRGWMPEEVTARAELLSYAEEDLYKELTLMQVELRFYDGEGHPWQPTEPVTVCLEGDVLEDVRAAEMDPTVYVYVEEPRDEAEPEEQIFSVDAFSAAHTDNAEKTYERELGEDVHAEVVENGLTKIEEAPKAVCFETALSALTFVVTARQPDRTYTAASENGQTELVAVGTLPRGLSVSVAAVPVEVEPDVLPGDAVLAWQIALTNPEVADYAADTTVKVALRDEALSELKCQDWDLQLWQLRQDAEPVRVKDAAFQGENLRFSADTLSTFVVVQVPVERHLTATDGETYSVKASYDSRAGIPANAELEVRELLPEEQGYASYLNKSAQRLGCSVEDLEFARVFDITLRDPETGAEYQPSRDVKVSIELTNANFAGCAQVGVLRIGQETEVVDSYVKGDAVAFETGDFSVCVVMGVSKATTVTAGDGSTYEVTVSYDKSAGIPADAELQVRELTGDEYDEYLKKTAEFLSRDEEQLVYTRLFDITIVKDGVVYEPNKAVDVSIRLADRPETQGVLRVVHFGEEKTELLDNQVAEDGCLQFATSSFSVYAITDEDGKVLVPRAFYYFYDGDPKETTYKSRQIIKNLGTLTDVTHNNPASQAFLGWYIWNKDTETWGEEVSIGTPIQVMFGKEAAAYGNSVVVPHVNDDDKTNHIDVAVRARYTYDFATIYFRSDAKDMNSTEYVNTETVPMPAGETSTGYELPDASNSDLFQNSAAEGFIFVGWSKSKPNTKWENYKQVYNFFDENDKREPLTNLTVARAESVTLYPVFKKAHWLIFKSGPVGSGATIVRSVYVLNKETPEAKKPADPSWRGHKFQYWTLTQTFDDEIGETLALDPAPTEFNWKAKLTADTTVYGYWEDGYTTYTVITWKQSINDDKNAPPQERTYEFDSQETREGKIKTKVYLTDADKNQTFTGFHHKTERADGDKHVDSEYADVVSGGSTVLNVYYDRDLMTMQFYSKKGYFNAPNGGYNSNVWKTGENVNTLTGLYGQPLSKYGYSWPTGTWTYYVNANSTMGMSYLGQFVFPDHDMGTIFRAYKTGDSGVTQIDFYLQQPDGTYTMDYNDSGAVNSAGNFQFSDKYDGFAVSQYRRYYWENNVKKYVDAGGNLVANGNDAWANASIGDSTPLTEYVNTTGAPSRWYYSNYYNANDKVYYYEAKYSGEAVSTYDGNAANQIMAYVGGGSFAYYNGYPCLKNPRSEHETDYNDKGTQYARVNYNGKIIYVQLTRESGAGYSQKTLCLEVRYNRRNYSISYFDSMDGQALTTLLVNGATVKTRTGIRYESTIADFYPDPEFEPTAKEPGWDFNGRWFSDQACTTQVFFHDLTEQDVKNLWYYIDAESEGKVYTGKIPSGAELGMTLENDGRQYYQDEYEVIKVMPNRNLAVYAGFTHTWYWVKIDPNGGYLNNNDPSKNTDLTYFWKQYESKLTQYSTGRNFVEDDAGTWYYHYDAFNEKNPDGTQPKTRKAYYTQNKKDSTDGKTYRKVETDADEGYAFAGWYLVDDSTGTEKYEKFNFEESFVTGNTLLRAMWKQKGNYRVYYSTVKALDPNGNEIKSITVGGKAPVDTFKYANDSAVPIMVGVMDAINKDSNDKTEYDFIGWYYNNGIYAAGDIFFANAYLAEKSPAPYPGEEDLYNTFVLYPVFRDKGEGNNNSGRTTLILDSNDGVKNPEYKSLPAYAYFSKNNKQVYYSESAQSNEGMTLNMDAELPLPADQNGMNVFIKDKSEFLGWAFSKDAKTPAFKAGQMVGVDNDDGGGFDGKNGNTLYAVWRRTEITVRVKLVDEKTAQPIRGGEYTLTDAAGAFVPGTEGGLVSNNDGLLAKNNATDFDVLTPTKPGSLTYYNITETLNAPGYIGLDAPVQIYVEYDGTVKLSKNGEKCQVVRVANDIYMVVIRQRQAVCKVVYGGSETLFASLNEAVAYAKKQNPSVQSRIEMLTDYEMPKSDFVTIGAGENILLTTASKDSHNPYRGEGTTATITRADSGTSLFTMDGGSFTMTNIWVDGGSKSNKTCVNDGGIVRVNNGTLTVSEGTILMNSNVSSNTNEESHGGAISATGSNAHVVIRSDDDPIQISGCTAKHSGGGVSVSGGASLLVDNAEFSNCSTSASGREDSYGGGAISIRGGANNVSDPDAVISGVSFKNCGTDGLGGAVLASDAAVSISDSEFGDANRAKNGGAIAVREGANLNLFSTEIYGGSATKNGGAIYMDHASVTLDETSITGNTAETGAGVYVSAGSKLYISGDLDFGGTGVNTDGSINNNAGNHATGTLIECTNGSEEYTKARQDIYLAEPSTEPSSLVITGNLTGENGSIWVWAEYESHYMTSKPFAVIDSEETIDINTYSVFRNAQVDDKTLCTGDYLTGKSGDKDFIYWTGGRNVSFLKIDGNGQPLADAIFGVYIDLELTVPVNRKNDRLVAVSDADGVTTFENLSPNIYFMQETQAPEHCRVSETKYVILVGSENLVIPDQREGLWADLLSELTQEDLDAESAKNLELFELPEYAIFAIDNTTGKAVATRSIAESGIMNMSDAVWPVILSKINTKLERLPGAHFVIRSIDGTVYAQGEVEEFESDDSGVFFAGRLPYGTYYLEETAELKVGETEYAKPTHYFVFQVSENGVMALKVNDDGEYEFAPSNTVVEPDDETYLIPEENP